MSNGLLTMSQKELDRLTIVQKVISKHLKQVHAAKQLGITTRHMRRLLRAYKAQGAKALISKHRGKSSNNRLSDTTKEQAKHLIKSHYHDFGPTFANEKLTENHNLKLSVESTRVIMIEAGLWHGKKRKPLRLHPMRTRRSCLGELVQIDGSLHDWFEGRIGKCCLLVFIDDATSRLMWLHFANEESTAAYFKATEAYLKHHGKPVSFYSDRHSIFRVNIPEAKSGTGETQFSRAMKELDIKLICANSPQAKGRVERANSTLQDRLVKEMRLRSISDIPTANAFLPQFIKDHNKRFAKAPASAENAHRNTLPNEIKLQQIFSKQSKRKLSKNLELSYNNIIYQIQTKNPSYAMRGSAVMMCERDDQVTIIYKGKNLQYKTINKHNQSTPIITAKALEKSDPEIKGGSNIEQSWCQYANTETRRAPRGRAPV